MQVNHKNVGIIKALLLWLKKKNLKSARSLQIAKWCVMVFVWPFPLFHGTLSEEANYLQSTRGVPGPGHSTWRKYYLIKSQFNEILLVV